MRSERIKQAREWAGLSQEDLAARLNSSQGQIWRWESGQSKPSSDYISKMAQVLEVTSDYLLGLTDDPTARITWDDLSPSERRLIDAVRKGLTLEMLKALLDIAQGRAEGDIVIRDERQKVPGRENSAER